MDFERFLDLEVEGEVEESSPVAEDKLPRSISAAAVAMALAGGTDWVNARERRDDLSGSAD